MKVLKEKKINEKFKTYDELRQAAWDVANGMSYIDSFRSDTKNFITYVEIYFNSVRDGNVKRASLAEKIIKDMLVSLQKNYKL